MAPTEVVPEGATRTSVSKERKRDRQQNARIRELKAAAVKAEEAIAQNEGRIAEIEAQMADPTTYADQAKLMELTQRYQAEQQAQESLYDRLEQAELAYQEATDEA